MKKIILGALVLLNFYTVSAQQNEKDNLKKNEEAIAKSSEEKPNGWTKKGLFTFLLFLGTGINSSVLPLLYLGWRKKNCRYLQILCVHIRGIIADADWNPVHVFQHS